MMEKRVANSEPSNDKHYDLLSLLTLLSAGNPYREESKPTMVAPKRRNISNGDLYGPSIAGVNFPTNCFPSPRGRTTALRAACATPACLPHRESGGGCLQPPSRGSPTPPFVLHISHIRWISNHVDVISRQQ